MTTLTRTRHCKTAKPTPVDNRVDSFSEAWGATTQWKYGVPRSQRFNLNCEIPDPARMQSRLIAPIQPPPVRAPFVALDKPLPPLPPEASLPVGLPVPPRSSVGTSSGLEHTRSRDLSIPSSSERSTTSSSLIQGVRRKPIFGFGKKRRQKSINIPQRPLMVDRGTQTSPIREEPKEPKVPKKPETGSSDSSRTTIRSTRTVRKSPKKSSSPSGSKTPLWSPRAGMTLDYFRFPFEKRERKSDEQNDSLVSTPKAHYRNHKPSPPSPKRRSNTDATADSVGTYESRYSSHPIEEQPEPSKPPLSRNAHSDPTKPKTPKAVEPEIAQRKASTPAQTITPPTAPSQKATVPSQKRPPPLPVQKFHSSHHQRRPSTHRRESSGGNISPLRQEVIYNEIPPYVPPENMERHLSRLSPKLQLSDPLSSYDTPALVDRDAPDHLLGSPLCALHPKNKAYGRLACPYHGRRKSMLDSDEAGEISTRSSSLDGEDWRRAMGEVAAEAEDDEKGFRLVVEEHAEDSVLCPANPRNAGGRAVCVFHGRGRLAFAGSDESVPRVRHFVI